jgi:ClpP class serine protease
MQAEVDRLYNMFVDTVARNRGISTQRVKDTQAALFWGPDAVKSGLADSAGNIGDALGALASVLPTVTAPQRVISIAGTSVAANSEQKEVTFVSENNNPVADQIPATQPEPAAVAPQPAPVASTVSIPATSTVTYSLALLPQPEALQPRGQRRRDASLRGDGTVTEQGNAICFCPHVLL